MIDCANDYANEHVIGEALEEIFSEGIVTRYYYQPSNYLHKGFKNVHLIKIYIKIYIFSLL